MMRQVFFSFFIWAAAFGSSLVLQASPAAALGPSDVSAQCDSAARSAADATGVPVKILMAISRVEAGRSIDGVLSPWPWTVNQAGSGAFLDTLDDALVHVRSAMAGGASNIDIGCFQINLHWHGTAFPSLESMFDPEQNALYAARFLLQLFEEKGSWDGAIGAYHSRTDTAADRYLGKVTAVLNDDTVPDFAVVAEATPPEVTNRFPLLRAGTGRSAGSLVATESTTPLISLLR